MNIAYVMTRADSIGGVQVHVRDLAQAAQAQGHSTTVLTGGTGPFVEDLRARGIPVVGLRHLTVPIHPLRDLRALREIHAELVKLRPQLLALHSSKAGVLGRIVGRRLGIPSILTAHGWNFTPGISAIPAAIYRQIERSTGPLLARIITVSEYDRRLALDAGIAGEDRIVTVYNGLADVPERLRADPRRSPVRLVMVARFGPQKDHPTLLRALAGLQDHAWDLDLIGDGPLMDEMTSLASALGIGGRVHLLGQRMDVGELLARAQVSLLATNWEGFPLSILEAMRAGLPVVASSVAGIVESVENGRTGYLVPRGDVELLRDRIRHLLTDSDLRARLGAEGRARYERQFTLTDFVNNTLAVYRDVLAQTAGGGRNGRLKAEPMARSG